MPRKTVKKYDIFDIGEELLALSDSDVGALLKALLRLRSGSLVRVESLPAAVQLLFKRECRRLNESEARQREINSARRAAVLSRYSRNSEEPFAQNEEKTGTHVPKQGTIVPKNGTHVPESGTIVPENRSKICENDKKSGTNVPKQGTIVPEAENPSPLFHPYISPRDLSSYEESSLSPRTGETECFEEFWNRYGRKRCRKETLAFWNRMPQRDRDLALSRLDGFLRMHPDPNFRPDPIRYLRHRRWEDEPCSPVPAAPAGQAVSMRELFEKFGG